MTEAELGTQPTASPPNQFIRLFADADLRQELLTLGWTMDWPPPLRLAQATHREGMGQALLTQEAYEEAQNNAQAADTVLEKHYEIIWFNRVNYSKLSADEVMPGSYLARGAAYVMETNRLDIRCNGCFKTPEQLAEYVEAAADDETDPISWVQREEGTYNHSNGHFLCTACYIRAGSPSMAAPGRWVAP